MLKLRKSVAEELTVGEETLKTDEIKSALLNTFQTFMLKRQSPEEDLEEEEIVVKKPKTVTKKTESKTKTANDSKTKSVNESKPKKAVTERKPKTKSSEDSNNSSSPKEAQIERLKSYIFKCGLRKVW